MGSTSSTAVSTAGTIIIPQSGLVRVKSFDLLPYVELRSALHITAVDITMNGQKLEEVTSFKYLEATRCKDGTYSAEVRIRIASAMAVMARQNRTWRCTAISFASKYNLQVSCHLHPPLRL